MPDLPVPDAGAGLNGKIAGVSMPVVAVAMVLQLLGIKLPSQAPPPVESPTMVRQAEQTREVLEDVRDALGQLSTLQPAIARLEEWIGRRSRSVDRLVRLLESSMDRRSLPPWLPQPSP